MSNWLGVVVCFVYIFAVIGVAEGLRRWRGLGSDFTRKFVHIGVGMMAWGVHWLFDTPWFFMVACGAFVIINWLDWRFGFFASMMSSDRANLGTVYFPLMMGVATYFFWEQRPLLVAAVMPLTWGDGMAPIIGRRYGRRAYFVHNSKRTVAGSAAFLVSAWLFTWLALWLLPGMPMLTPQTAWLPALVLALVTMVVEAVSIWGLDNVTITAVAILFLRVWPFA